MTGAFKTKQMQLAEQRLGQTLEQFIEARYAGGATQAEIAAALGVNTATVSRWMSHLGIEAYYGPRRPRVSAA
jgi:DNA-directed RNA polymerase specialized sigma24 family protein